MPFIWMPNWMIWGLLALGALFWLVLAASGALVPYPDTTPTPATYFVEETAIPQEE